MELIELISRKFGIDCIKSVLNILHVLYSWQRSTTVRLLVPLEDLILVKSRLTCLADFKMVWWVWYHQSQVKLWCVDTSGIIFPFYWETKQHEDEAWPQKLSSPFTELGIQPSLLNPVQISDQCCTDWQTEALIRDVLWSSLLSYTKGD